MTFEEKIKKIEELSKQLQDPKTPLDKAVDIYEQAVKLAKETDSELSKLERKVEIVTKADAEGVVTQPYSDL